MASLGGLRTGFRFDGRASVARKWDIRFRVASIGLTSAAVLASPPMALVPLGVLVAVLLALAGSKVGEILRVIRGFSGFLVFFVVLGVAFEPTWSQAAFLGLQAARLTLLLLLGHFLFLTATPMTVTEGIRWYLGWLGPRRAWGAASMASWALASVPLVLDQARGLLDAAALRGLEPKRHPLRTINLLTLALLVRTLGRSLDLASALEARGFGQAIPPLELKARSYDWAAMAALITWVGCSWFLLPGAILGA